MLQNKTLFEQNGWKLCVRSVHSSKGIKSEWMLISPRARTHPREITESVAVELLENAEPLGNASRLGDGTLVAYYVAKKSAKWSLVKPTQPGWYWIRKGAGHAPTIVHVRDVCGHLIAYGMANAGTKLAMGVLVGHVDAAYEWSPRINVPA